MGEDLSLEERNPVRTPMQWSDDRNAGFSSASPEALVHPVVNEGSFRYADVNVAAQHDRPGSIMEHMQRLIRIRRSCPEVGWGDWQILETGEPSVLALRYDWRGKTIVALHNLADREVEARISCKNEPSRLVPLFCSNDDRTPYKARDPIPLGSYGFVWLRASSNGGRPGEAEHGAGHA